MPIKNLTHQEAAFPRLGVLKKGEPKKETAPGRDLEYFRLDAKEEIVESFKRIYGTQPKRINVVLPYEKVEQCFPAYMEEWQPKTDVFIRRCDGENQVIYLKEDNVTYSKKPIPCFEGCKCKPSGKLYIVIPELKRLGYIEVLTHSKWDIIELHRNLQAVYNFAGDLRTVPFILSRSPREIKIPLNGRRVKQIKHLLNIEINPNYTQQVIEQKELKRIEQSYEQ